MTTTNSTQPGADGTPVAPRPEYKSYGDIVWSQYRKYRLSYWSLWGVGILFLLAITAPVWALNVPFYLHVPAGVGPSRIQGTTFPWFRALFDANVESGVDIFFNSLLFTVPAAFITWFLVRKYKTFPSRKHHKQFRLWFIMVAALLMAAVFIAIYMYGYSEPYVDYLALSHQHGVSAVFPPIRFSYRDINLNAVGLSPTWKHWLGTDREGRDVFTRLVYGTRISLTVGVVAVSIYATIGTILGSLAGYFGGSVDMIISRLLEVMMCFPTFFLILTLRGFIDKASIFDIMLIIGLTGWTGVARLVRGEFLRLRNQDFVQAATALGLKQPRIIFRHLLPNAMAPVLVAATFGVAGAILIEASLSFLGLGPTTAPSWGGILTTGRDTGQMALILAPGFAIFLTISLLNLVGEGVRDAIDPKMRH